MSLKNKIKKLPEKMSLKAKWESDYQNQKHFDGPVISLYTTYLEDDGPSAISTFIINYKEYAGVGTEAILTVKEFEGKSSEDVKVKVEFWAQKQMDRIVSSLIKEFKEEA